MYLLSFLAFVLSFSLSESKKDIVIQAKNLGRHKERGVNYGNFKAHKNSYLNVDKVGVVLVHKLKDCGLACVNHYSCFSFNIAIRSDNYGHFVCELLATDKYNESSMFVASGDFHHFSIATPCLSEPCKNGATCSPRYKKDTYKCVCRAGFTGKHCEIDIDDCVTGRCKNGATCVDLVNDYRCTCAAGWSGKDCDTTLFDTKGKTGRVGIIQKYTIGKTGVYLIKAGGARGGTHSYNYGYKPGTYYGGRGATMEGRFRLSAGTVLNIVVGQRGGNSVEVKGGNKTKLTAAQLKTSVEDNAGTGGGGGSFVYKTDGTLLIVAGGGGGASGGYNGTSGQAGTSGTSSVGLNLSQVRAGGKAGQPGQCNNMSASYHGGVGAGWFGQGCPRASSPHGESGGSRAQGWVGGRAGGMNSGFNGGPEPGAVGGFGGGGGGSEDNGASGGGGGYSGGGSGTHSNQAGGGGGSYCDGSGCKGVTGGNTNENGFVTITSISTV